MFLRARDRKPDAVPGAQPDVRDAPHRLLEQGKIATTVEEAVVKYGYRYATGEEWGRLRRLFRTGVLVKWAWPMSRTHSAPNDRTR